MRIVQGLNVLTNPIEPGLPRLSVVSVRGDRYPLNLFGFVGNGRHQTVLEPSILTARRKSTGLCTRMGGSSSMILAAILLGMLGNGRTIDRS